MPIQIREPGGQPKYPLEGLVMRTYRLHASVVRRIEALAAKQKRSKQEVMTEALTFGLDRLEGKKAIHSVNTERDALRERNRALVETLRVIVERGYTGASYVAQLALAADAKAPQQPDTKLADLYAACHAVFLTFDHPNWRGDDETIEPIRDLMNLVPFDQRTKEEQQAVQLSRRTRLAEAEAKLARVQTSCNAIAITIRSGRVSEVTPTIAEAWASELDRVVAEGPFPIGAAAPDSARPLEDADGRG